MTSRANATAPGDATPRPYYRGGAAFGLGWVLMANTSALQADEPAWRYGGLDLRVSGVFTVGAAWRMEARADDLVGKLNVEGQQTLCAADDCISLTGDPEPNQRLIDARGAFSGTNGDDGNLNYDQYDMVSATARLTPTVTASWGPLQAKVRGIAYFDPVNDDFDETHPNTLYQPAHTRRPEHVSEDFARGFELLDAYALALLPVGYEQWSLTAGNQILQWGEATLTLFNTINEINPLNGAVARMPGVEINEIKQAVPLVTLGGALAESWSFELFYQLQWKPVITDPRGSFMSTNDVIGGGAYFMNGLGQFAEDPDRQYTPAGLQGLISQASRTAYLLPEDHGYPSDHGQFGLQLKYFAEALNNGTELGFYYQRYHSRLPYLSVYAGDESCTRQAVSNAFLEVLLACRGFNNPLNPLGLEPLPADTTVPFLDYPENIDLFGLSAATNLGRWALASELAYRPDMPLGVQFTDVMFAALAPTFPKEDIEVPLDGLPLFTLPGHRTAVPDFLSRYRGLDQYAAGDLVSGYERLPVAQLVLNGVRSFGNSNPVGADQITWLVEFGVMHIFDLPALSDLQFEGSGDRTHYSPGADGSGDPDGVANTQRTNPTQQTGGFATAWSFGYRSLLRLSYSDIWRGIALNPTLIWFHDLHGVSPAQADNYVEGRMTALAALDAQFTRAFGGGVQYQLYAGAGSQNTRRDRDNLAVFFRYAF